MKWIVAAPFFAKGKQNRWIDDFVTDPALQFRKVLPADALEDRWHSRSQRGTGLVEWMDYWRHCRKAFKAANGCAGIITLFPQLALLAALRKRVSGARAPIIAWCFNIGAPPGRLKRLIGRWAFQSVNHFVVHSSREVTLAKEWFGIPERKVTFVPLQKGEMTIRATEDTREPFIVAMGSANRDYRTLIEAIDGTGIPLTIVAAPRCIAHLRIPKNVTHLHDLTHAACLELAARARISVIPLLDVEAASGQVTFLEAMRLGRPVITTRSPGTEDYITDGQTGLLVPVGDSRSLREAIHSLWTDGARRQLLADAARHYAQAHFSDEAIAMRLRQILLETEKKNLPKPLRLEVRRSLPWR